jgi:hypothetical protein
MTLASHQADDIGLQKGFLAPKGHSIFASQIISLAVFSLAVFSLAVFSLAVSACCDSIGITTDYQLICYDIPRR